MIGRQVLRLHAGGGQQLAVAAPPGATGTATERALTARVRVDPGTAGVKISRTVPLASTVTSGGSAPLSTLAASPVSVTASDTRVAVTVRAIVSARWASSSRRPHS